MFVGRTAELKQLHDMYESERNNLAVVYGRYGIGKTALISEFMKEKRAYYYLARECTEQEQLILMKDEMEAEYEKVENSSGSYYGFISEIIAKNSGKPDTAAEKSVIIIDEFQHMLPAGSFMSDMVRLLNEQTSAGGTMIILCSSSVNWIENDMVAAVGSTARYISGFIKLRELSFMELGEWFPEFSSEECVCVNSILGGVPGYLKLWNAKLSVADNVKTLFLHPEAVLYSEGENFLRRELRELTAYNTILCAMAEGRTKLNAIYEYSGFSRAKISVYLKNLIQIGVVEKVFSEDSGKADSIQKGVYRICDNFIHFWYRFIFKNLSMISLNQADYVYMKRIEPALAAHMQESFADMCGEYLRLMNRFKRLQYVYAKWSCWYGKNGKIDIIARNDARRTLFGYCFSSELPMNSEDMKSLDELILQNGLKADELFVFSKSGFTMELKSSVKEMSNVKLIAISDL